MSWADEFCTCTHTRRLHANVGAGIMVGRCSQSGCDCQSFFKCVGDQAMERARIRESALVEALQAVAADTGASLTDKPQPIVENFNYRSQSIASGGVLNIDADATAKPSNPKDLIGSDKLPLHLWPETASALGCLGLLDGMLKYGRSNWRAAGVRFTIYDDALKRHMARLREGQDIDPDSGLPHLAHALACLAIIADAQASGKLVDDRQYAGGFFEGFLADMTSHVKRLKQKYLGRNPKHYTIADNPQSVVNNGTI